MILNKDNSKKQKKIFVFTTGGTIAQVYDNNINETSQNLTGEALLKFIPKSITNKYDINVVNHINIDSSQMNPNIWLELGKKIINILSAETPDGIIITHGTDTMSEGSFFLNLLIKTTIPIIFTGAMRSSNNISADGPINIYNCILQIDSENNIYNSGITVNMNNKIMSSTHIRKIHSSNVNSFNCGEHGYIGSIVNDSIISQNSSKDEYNGLLNIPDQIKKVALITTFPGDNGDFIFDAIEKKYSGIVIEAFGLGNLSKQSSFAIKKAIDNSIPVVITTRVFDGCTFPCYGGEGGGAHLKKIGAILAKKLSGQKAHILLTSILSQPCDSSIEKYIKYF